MLLYLLTKFSTLKYNSLRISIWTGCNLQLFKVQISDFYQIDSIDVKITQGFAKHLTKPDLLFYVNTSGYK